MAVIRLKNGNYQARLEGSDGRMLTKVFGTRREATKQQQAWKDEKAKGRNLCNRELKLTLDDYFLEWFREVPSRASKNWRKQQVSLYTRFVSPNIGRMNVAAINPSDIGRTLRIMEACDASPHIRRHAFVLLRMMFSDAVETFELRTSNPVLKKFKPVIPQKEARYLRISEIVRLVNHVKDKPFGTAIWLQLFLGLRFGEMRALEWDDLDFESGIVHIRRTFVTSEWTTKDTPKGRKQHSNPIPMELLQHLSSMLRNGKFVATSPEGKAVCYKRYVEALKAYCDRLNITKVGTHGLRHSTSLIYMNAGATRFDMQVLFAHSDLSVTNGYIHGRQSNLCEVVSKIRLLTDQKTDQIDGRIRELNSAPGNVFEIKGANARPEGFEPPTF